MKIVLWTQSPPKIAAIEEAAKKCIYFEWQNIEIIPLKVSSDITEMPITMDDIMLWAKNRAYNCKKEMKADFYVWKEWGISMIWDKAYLYWVTYILNNNEEGHFGFSNMMEVPEYFRQKVYDEWLELWPILAKKTKEEWAAQKWGSFAHWSDNMLTRKEQFMVAFLWAISPFYNKYYE